MPFQSCERSTFVSHSIRTSQVNNQGADLYRVKRVGRFALRARSCVYSWVISRIPAGFGTLIVQRIVSESYACQGIYLNLVQMTLGWWESRPEKYHAEHASRGKCLLDRTMGASW